MRVVTRIQLSTAPALLGLITVALLAYFGEYSRQAPTVLVALVAVAAVASSLLAWHNARVLVLRVRALSSGFRALGLTPVRPVGVRDEFDELDAVRDQVSSLARSEEELRDSSALRVRAAEERLLQYELSLQAVATVVQQQLEEARLALHILQTSPFGDLNENQEELIAAARAASEAANDELRVFARLAGSAGTALSLPLERQSLKSVMETPLAMALGGHDAVHTSSRLLLPADLPRVMVHLTSAHEALAALLRFAAAALAPSDRLQVKALADGNTVHVTVTPFPIFDSPVPLRCALALRLLEAQRIDCREQDGEFRLRFLSE